MIRYQCEVIRDKQFIVGCVGYNDTSSYLNINDIIIKITLWRSRTENSRENFSFSGNKT